MPIFSLIKKILHAEPLSSILLIFQNHAEREIIFKKQLDETEKRSASQFKWLSFLSKPQAARHTPQKLNNFILKKLIDDHADRKKENLLYLCGPPSFMRMAQFTLKWMGFHDDQIKKENFTIEHTHPPPLISDRSTKEILIHYNKQTFEIRVAYPLSILQAALNKNIQLPYSCRAGRCSSCVAKCIKGKVIMSTNEVLTEKDIEDGLVLTCVGYAKTDVELAF